MTTKKPLTTVLILALTITNMQAIHFPGLRTAKDYAKKKTPYEKRSKDLSAIVDLYKRGRNIKDTSIMLDAAKTLVASRLLTQEEKVKEATNMAQQIALQNRENEFYRYKRMLKSQSGHEYADEQAKKEFPPLTAEQLRTLARPIKEEILRGSK